MFVSALKCGRYLLPKMSRMVTMKITCKSRLGGCAIFKESLCSVLMLEESEVVCAVFEGFAVIFSRC